MTDVPAAGRFPGPDELDRQLVALAEAYPDQVHRQRIGTSRLGDPITMLSVGQGERNALVFAGPHPNEPIGFLTVAHLVRLLCEVPELRYGYTWHCIGCIDPDGARLNEGWYAGPFTRRNYARHFYRPPMAEQPEWTFPALDPGAYFDRVLPETQALMRAIDLVRPDMMCSLHNREFGGMYYYVTADGPGLADALAALPVGRGVPLHMGGPEIPGARRIRPGVFHVPAHDVVRDVVDGKQAGHEARFGTSSLHYAQQHGTFSLVVEVPMWSDDRSCNQDACGRTTTEIMTEAADDLATVSGIIGEHIDHVERQLWVPRSPFATSSADLRTTTDGLAAALRGHADTTQDVQASIADLFELRQTVHMLRLRVAGTALRLLDGELAVGNHSRPVRTAHRGLLAVFDEWADTADENGVETLVPLEKAAGLQVDAILTAAEAVRDSR
ncbi:M14 family zinc carboxypeptidase [Amycolatopsis vastitatis]|uniref:M14 family zinc carboxypeptidase n=1 Tax=Amycolatopsis vastitatis TaxID=1905142 RepID=UPI00130460AD|nr:M14 family zinc carboxypeptidase [Amycolatopsis vastitatis]